MNGIIDWQSETLPPLRDNLDGAEILRLAAINLRKSAAELDRLADEMQPEEQMIPQSATTGA